MRTVLLLLAAALAGCGLADMAAPAQPQVPPVQPGARIAFTVPEGWTRVPGTAAMHYFTTGDPDPCADVVGGCDPATYVMMPGTMDVAIEAIEDDTSCAEDVRPTWDGRIEGRPDRQREATFSLSWTVCYPDTTEAVRIAADLRAGETEVREALLGDLRTFVESLVLLEGGGLLAPEK